MVMLVTLRGRYLLISRDISSCHDTGVSPRFKTNSSVEIKPIRNYGVSNLVLRMHGANDETVWC